MNASQIAEAVSAIDAALSYLLNVPYTTNAEYTARREVLMKLAGSKGGLTYELKQIKVEVSNAQAI